MSIYPDDYHRTNKHKVQLGEDPSITQPTCQANGHHHHFSDGSFQYKVNEEMNGSTKRIYTLAIVTTYEFFLANGSSEEAATEAVIAAVNAINEIYENELAVTFSLLPPKIFTVSDDPFDPDLERQDQANEVIFDNFDFHAFDIGHVINAAASPWPGGGVTNISILCEGTSRENSRKGGGWSGGYTNLNFYFIYIFAHELGHMFGATHTWNGEGGSCLRDQYAYEDAYELGSGSTIMSYNGNCGNGQNTPRANQDFFHSSSIFQMIDHMKTSSSRCVQLIQEESGNTAPQVDANPCNIPSLNIPHSTPFYLKGHVTDDRGTDDLSYAWEQFDSDTTSQGYVGEQASQSIDAPLFRTFNPSPSPIRYFPDIGTTLNNGTDVFQNLPAVARDMNFKLVARDNHPGAGGVGIDGVRVNVSEFGPFEITSLNNRRFNLGDELIITWDTNGSDEVCENVAILLSYNSGLSFDYTLADGLPYSTGEASIIIPDGVVNTSFAMLMLACDDHECFRFYDLFNSQVSFTSDCNIQPSTICDNGPISAEQGSEDLNLDLEVIISDALITAKSTSCGLPTYPNASSGYIFIAVGQEDNRVKAITEEADFRSLNEGNYLVYGVSYKAAGQTTPAVIDPSMWLDQYLDNVVNRDFCTLKSDNAIPLEVTNSGLPCAFTYDIGPTVPGFRTIRCLSQITYNENIRDNEAIVVNNLVLGRKYSFTFCEGYNANVFEARVIVQEYNSENETIGAILSDATGCQHEIRIDPFSNFDDIIIIITDNNNCQTTTQNIENGIPNFRCAVGRNLDDSDDVDNIYADIDQSVSSAETHIFPNPAQNELNIIVRNGTRYDVVITDLTGKVIATHKNTAKMNISNLPVGVYLAHIKDEVTTFNVVEKFVVIR